MFTSSGDVLLAPRSNSDASNEPSTSGVNDLNESNQSSVLMNDVSSQQLNLSTASTASASDVSFNPLNQYYTLDGLGFPIKRGRGRPRKKPLPVDVPLIKKKRGRPPKIIKLGILFYNFPNILYFVYYSNQCDRYYQVFAIGLKLYAFPSLSNVVFRTLTNSYIAL